VLLTLERIWQSVLEEVVASPGELERIDADLRDFCKDPTTVMSVLRIVQAWGRKRTIQHRWNGDVPRSSTPRSEPEASSIATHATARRIGRLAGAAYVSASAFRLWVIRVPEDRGPAAHRTAAGRLRNWRGAGPARSEPRDISQDGGAVDPSL
jgi:hypothetical protein